MKVGIKINRSAELYDPVTFPRFNIWIGFVRHTTNLPKGSGTFKHFSYISSCFYCLIASAMGRKSKVNFINIYARIFLVTFWLCN